MPDFNFVSILKSFAALGIVCILFGEPLALIAMLCSAAYISWLIFAGAA